MSRQLMVCLVSALALANCGGRTIAGSSDDSGTGKDNGASRDTQAKVDISGRDMPDKRDRNFIGPDKGAPTTFCSGGPAAKVDDKPVQVSNIKTHMNVVASCCGPGEIIDFKTVQADGTPATISLQIARFPNVPLPPQIKLDLAYPPKGWYFAIYCNPSSFCGMAHSTSHAFEGWIELQSLLGAPAVQVSACVTARPTNPITPSKRAIQLWANKAVVNKACVPGMDQTCNNDPKVSSIKGKCNPNSTCTCNPGSKKMPNGKCQ